MEEFEFAFVEAAVVLVGIQSVCVDDARKEIVEDDVLIVEANELLHFREGRREMVRDHAIVKVEKKAL